MKSSETVYAIGKPDTTAADIESALREIWGNMMIKGSLEHELAVKHHLTPESLPTSADEALEVRPAAAGVVTPDVIVAGLLSKMAYDVWASVWKDVLWPSLKKKLGDEVLRPVETKKNADGG
ncbi:MAG: hypothetical protein DI587_11135 [Variovorax paradoxus]|nr:MAG: hypothetical protein DI583_11135 [Variovorax paradoxus]PZQ11004.1 MAG: hypothetical protein DI587_11135 [Variovorax paradoxus]